MLIITHPGSAHLDDFLSCCFVISKCQNIKKIKRKEPNNGEIKDPSIWKLDVGENYDPEIRCFDHHQNEITNDCTISLLLKKWDMWSIASKVHKWLNIVVIRDTIGPEEVKNKLRISYKAMGELDSFVERTMLDKFKKQKEIKSGSLLFTLMKMIGDNFFFLIDEYNKTVKDIEGKIEYKIIEGVQSIFCHKGLKHSSTLLRIIRDRMREKWPDMRGGIAVYPNQRVKNTIAIRKYNNDERVDFSRIANNDKVLYVHPNGFFISLKKMSEDELEQYIKDAILN